MKKTNQLKAKLSAIFKNCIAYGKKHGAYIVLFFCLTLTGIAVGVIFKNAPKEQAPSDIQDVSDSNDERLQEVIRATPVPQFFVDSEEQAVLSPEYPALPTQNSAIPDFTQAPAPSSSPGVKELLNPPVSGEIVWGYALDELIYSETLDQWMTHPGVDIACREGETVRSVDAGTVQSVYSDDELGTTVVIAHSDGHQSVYAGLKEEVAIKEGDRVAKNAIIGECGDSAVSECGLISHIHFEYHVNGTPVNPKNYVRLG